MESAAPRSVLVIAYYFPPLGLSGVQRTLKFVKYLPQFGWQPTVLTVEPRGYLARDESLLAEIADPPVEVVRTPSFDPLHFFRGREIVRLPSAKVYGRLSRLSQLFFIPDNKIGWKRRALARARRLVAERRFDAVYATAPPYTDFLIGKELKREFRIPFVIDYRDAWLENPLHRYWTPLHRLRHHALEKEVLRRADRIVTINRRIKELIVAGYDDVAHGEVEIIPQGFDQEDFDAVEAAPSDGRMRITYSGTFYYNRSPRHFLEGLRIFLAEHPAARREVAAEFAGNFGDENIRFVREQGLEEQVILHGYVSHRESIAILKRASVLWMVLGGNPGDEMMSTGKLFEYFGARKPVLGCVPDGVARKAIEECGAGFIAPPADPRAVADALARLYHLYQTDALPKPDERFVLQYERRALTGRLAKILHSLVDHEGTFPA